MINFFFTRYTSRPLQDSFSEITATVMFLFLCNCCQSSADRFLLKSSGINTAKEKKKEQDITFNAILFGEKRKKNFFLFDFFFFFFHSVSGFGFIAQKLF